MGPLLWLIRIYKEQVRLRSSTSLLSECTVKQVFVRPAGILQCRAVTCFAGGCQPSSYPIGHKVQTLVETNPKC